MTTAWTLGYPPSYERAIRMPGNTKAPGGIIFQAREEAAQYTVDHADEAYSGVGTSPKDWAPYEVVLPGPWDEVTTRSRLTSMTAFHEWHTSGEDGQLRDARCGICIGDDEDYKLPYHALLKEAPFINPDTRARA